MIEPTNRKEAMMLELSTELDELKEELHAYKVTNTAVKKHMVKDLVKGTIATVLFTSALVGSVYAVSYIANKDKKTVTNDDIYAEVTELRTEMQELRDKYNSILDELRSKVVLEVSGTVYIDEMDCISEPANPYWWKERLPENIDTNRYDCEPDKFGKNSEQRKLQEECYTDPYTGIKVYEQDNKRYYCAAMASAYGIEIGEAWQVTLECGSIFNVILSDFQQPIEDPDPNYFGEIWLRDAQGNIIDILRNYDGEPVCHVLEFVVNLDALHPKAKEAGNAAAITDIFGGLYGNGGNIIEMKYLGKVWNNESYC